MSDLKIFKPTSAGQRTRISLLLKDLSKKPLEKSLLTMLKKAKGRTRGKVTVRHKGGGARKYYRLVDFKRNKFDVPARVAALEYDPNRNVNLAVLNYVDGEKRYILAPKDLKVGDVLESGSKVAIKMGNSLPLSEIPLGTLVHNLEINPGAGGVLVRSAGGAAQVMSKEVDGRFVQIKMPSGEMRRLLGKARATVGQLSNVSFRQVRLGKAGRNIHLGVRPTVRGVAQNPKTHPHGGGEGRSGIGMPHPKTPWGTNAFGHKTRRRFKTSQYIVSKKGRL